MSRMSQCRLANRRELKTHLALDKGLAYTREWVSGGQFIDSCRGDVPYVELLMTYMWVLVKGVYNTKRHLKESRGIFGESVIWG